MRVGLAAAARTALIALVFAGAVCGAGYAVERIGLRAPTDGERVTAKAVGVMLRYRYVQSKIRVDVRRPRTRFGVYVDRHSLVPLGVRVAARSVVGWSNIRTKQLTPALKRAFLERFGGG